MTFVVATISLEQELTKDFCLKHVSVALSFVKSRSRMPVVVCENQFEMALILKAECDKYVQIDSSEPTKFLVPIIDTDTGLEELVEEKLLGNIDHILLTSCESRQHDRVRDDWTDFINDQSGVEKLVDALESEGIFYE